jgi:hypothetical protein
VPGEDFTEHAVLLPRLVAGEAREPKTGRAPGDDPEPRDKLPPVEERVAGIIIPGLVFALRGLG